MRDSTSTTKIQIRAASNTAAASMLDTAYGSSRRFSDRVLVCGTRPEEWTVYGSSEEVLAFVANIPRDGFVTVIDITHGRALLRITGSKATSVLNKICNMDLSEELTPDGAVFSASVGNVSCDLTRNDQTAETSFLISCERSFGKFLFIAVADASTEFGLPIPHAWELHKNQKC